MTKNSLYLEDLAVGQKFTSGNSLVDEISILEFASQFDPQPFHTNVELAKNSFLRA